MARAHVKSLAVGLRVARHHMHEARLAVMPRAGARLPDVVADWDQDGHRVSLRAPRYDDFAEWRALRLANQQQMELHWDAQDRSWDQRHQLSDWVGVVANAKRGRRRRSALLCVLTIDGSLAGQANLEWIDEGSGTAECGAWLDAALHNRQLMRTAVAHLVDFAFAELSIDRIMAPIAVDNLGAQAAIASLGFTREGLMQAYAATGQGRTDHELWAITRNRHANGSVTPSRSWYERPVFDESVEVQSALHDMVPGGAHTYARGEDQYPDGMAPIISRGRGSHVWDIDGNEFIEYGAGLRSVTLGHAFPPVTDAVAATLARGNNFSRPSSLEVAAAEDFLTTVPTADMVKFAKNGSDTTTAALRLARAATGRPTVAICDQPFFSVDDWFIGTTPMNAGTQTSSYVRFAYNDVESLRQVLSQNDIAAVFMEAATALTEPLPGYLEAVRELCSAHGTVLIFDEMITGFRWSAAGAQAVYGVTPDLSCWGKALGNGFPIAALAGSRELMELGGLRASDRRVFLLSTTQGPESTALAAMRAVIGVYRTDDPVATMEARGSELAAGINECARNHGVADHMYVTGRPSCLMFVTKDADGAPSQEFRTLAMQELISRHVLGQSLVVSAAHTRRDVTRTIEAFDGAMATYRKALEAGSAESFLHGRPVAPALREYAAPRTPFPRQGRAK